jgi:hypothetical protein
MTIYAIGSSVADRYDSDIVTKGYELTFDHENSILYTRNVDNDYGDYYYVDQEEWKLQPGDTVIVHFGLSYRVVHYLRLMKIIICLLDDNAEIIVY